MKLFELLTESYPHAKHVFLSQGAPEQEIVDAFKQFKTLQDRIPTEHFRPIEAWAKLGWDKFVRYVNLWSKVPSNRELKGTAKVESGTDYKLLGSENGWNMYLPMTANGSHALGRGSRWCTAQRFNSYFVNYTNQGVMLIYLRASDAAKRHTDNGMYAIAVDENGETECFDKNDNRISFSDVANATGVNVSTYIDKVQSIDSRDTIRQHAITNKQIRSAIRSYQDNRNQSDKDFINDNMHIILRNPDLAYVFVRRIFLRRWPPGERAIAMSAAKSVDYAKFIESRFIEGEKVIATDPLEAHDYAYDVIKGRFPEGEKAIATDGQLALSYAIDIVKGRFPEGEKAIASDAETAYEYARNVLKGRFPEGEPTILKDTITHEAYNQYLSRINIPPVN